MERKKEGWKDARKKEGDKGRGTKEWKREERGNSGAMKVEIQVSSEVISDLPFLQRVRLFLVTCQ